MTAVRTDSTHPLKGMAARDVANTLRTISLGRVRDASNVLRTFFSSLSAAVSPASVGGSVNSGLPRDIQTGNATAQAIGGAAPYSYARARTDVGPGNWTINAPSSATTSFTGQDVTKGTSLDATFVCTITDAAGVSAQTEPVAAYVQNIFYNVGEEQPF